MKKLVLTVTIALLSLLASPIAVAANTPRPATNLRLSDAELDRVIRAKLAKSKIGKDGFAFKVKSGVVTWEGSTSVLQHKGAATRMARTAGATQVVNNIKISDEARRKASGNLSGAPRKVEVKSNLVR